MSTDLMRRLMACRLWKFTAGLQAEETNNGCISTLAWIDADGRWNAATVTGGWMRFRRDTGLAPVATDPLLPGWVLRLVREAWCDETATVSHWNGKWTVANGKGNAQVFCMCDSELGALVAALEVASVKP